MTNIWNSTENTKQKLIFNFVYFLHKYDVDKFSKIFLCE